MKAHYKTANGRMTFELQGENVKEVIKQLSAVQEVFESETTCGCCNSPAIRFQHRVVDEYDFYELQCLDQDCRARFSFGQAKKGGGLFPKRKGEDNKYLPNRGWVKYRANQGGSFHPDEEHAA